MKEKHTYRHVNTAGKLPEILRTNPYTVPNGYFENLHFQIIQKCQNAGDIQGPLAVPDSYFEQLTDSITAKIAEQALKAAVNESGFIVPTNYFRESEQLLIATSKIKEQAADTGFVVAEHYFDTLPDRIIRQRPYRQADTPVRKLNRSKWTAYVAAASIALVLGLAALFRVANDTSEAKSPLASVSDDQIVNYLELYGPPNDMIYISEELDDFDEQNIGEGISEADIEAYLNHTL